MNYVQELGDNELYNYDVLVRLLSDRFDPASRVSAFRSRFHGRSRRHHEDADTFADALAELCRVGYPQSPPELRQELIAEQFIRGQSDPESYTEEDGDLEDVFAVGDLPHGLIGDLRIQPRHPPYNRCLHWHVKWDTRCVRSPDSRMPNASLWGAIRSLIRNEGFARRHGPAGTTRGSSVSVEENLVICNPAAHDRTLPFPSNLQVGTFNLIIARNAMEPTTRETHHPHQSICTSFDPHVIFMHHIDFNFSYTGHYDHTYSTASEFMYRNMRVTRGSGLCGITGGVFTRRW